MCSYFDLDIVQGEPYSLSVSGTDDSGNPLNLSGYEVFAEMKYRFSDTGVAATFSGAVVSAASGIVSISLDSSGTAQLPVTQLIYTVQMIPTGVGANVGLLKGYVNVYPQITYNG